MVHASGTPAATPPQVVFVGASAASGETAFVVEPTVPWLRVISQSRRAPGRFSVAITDAPPASGGMHGGQVIVRRAADGALAGTIEVQLAVLGNASKPPFGSLDAPPADFTFGTSGVMFAGWALDDVAVRDVEICAARPGATTVASPGACGDSAKTLIGRAGFVYGGRPDVMKLFAVPRNDRAAWSYPLERAAVAPLGPGPFEIQAIARDVEGNATVIGKRLVTTESAVPTIPFPMISVGLLVACFMLAQCWLWERLRHALGVEVGTPASSLPVHWAEIAVLVVVTAAFGALQIAPMQRGLIYDELHTASNFVVGHTLWDAATSVSVFNNHIAFSLAAGVSSRVFGTAEWALRLPSVILGALSILAVWWLARTLSSRVTACLAAVLLAASPYFFFWSHMARGYAGLALMSTLSTAAFLALVRQPSPRLVWLHAISSVLAVYFNLYGIWIVIAQYLVSTALAVRGGGPHWAAGLRRVWLSFSCIAAALVVLHLPIMRDFAAVMVFRGRTPLRTEFPLELYLAYTGGVAWAGLNVVAVALALFGLVRQHRLVIGYFTISLVLPLVVMWYFVRPLDLYPRFFVYWMPLFSYLMAAGLWQLVELSWTSRGLVARGVSGGAAATAAMAMTLLVADWSQQNRATAPDGYAGVGRAAVRDDGWNSFAIGGDAQMLDYYLPRPVTVLHTAEQLERALHEHPLMQVGYHDMPWNSDVERTMAERLKVLCDSADAAPVIVYQCR